MGDDDSVLEKTEGTDIIWAEGKNPALKIVKKKPKKGAKEGNVYIINYLSTDNYQ